MTLRLESLTVLRNREEESPEGMRAIIPSITIVEFDKYTSEELLREDDVK